MSWPDNSDGSCSTTQMGRARELGWVVFDDLYGLCRPDNPDGPSELDDSNRSSAPDNLDRLSRLDDLDEPCQSTRMDRADPMLQRARRAQRLGWAGRVGLTIQTGRYGLSRLETLMGPTSLTVTSCQDITDFNNKIKKILITLHWIKHHFPKMWEI